MPDENVIIASVSNFPMRGLAEREKAMHADWAKKATHMIWRPNLGSPAGLTWGMPDIAITQATEDFRFAADGHCIGIFFDMFWYHWANQGPLYYALAHLAWNPRANVRAVMNDYYQRIHGPAAADMKAYWELLERTRMEFVAEKSGRARVLPQKYTFALLAKAQSHLDAATAKLASADEKYRRRLHFTRCGFEFTKLVVGTRAAMQKFEASKGKDAAAKAQVLANWAKVDVMEKEYPAFAINWRSVFAIGTPGGRNKRTEGLHPDAPLSSRTLKEMQAAGLE